MPEAKRMVTGFNHNVKHLGKVYHVQTEDSGLGNPHIITHLFVGGNILASRKTSYADIVGAENLTQVVRELMEEQHKEMLRNLINGVYDEVDQSSGERAQHYQPGQLGGDLAAPSPIPAAPAPPAPARRASAPAAPRSPQATPPPPAPAAPAAPPPRAGPPAQEPPQVRNPVAPPAIGEDLISEKSLDEVILSYLAEDLGAKK